MATLYIVATPIGNLSDLSKRALDILKSVNFVLCEDTRVSKKLLNHFNIKTKTISFFQHSKDNKIEHILDLLKEGKNLALVSDAGTPGISDPGNKLIQRIVEVFGDEIDITAIPGPSAVSTAASISGFPMDSFLFLGFPPAKRKREKFFQEIINSKYPVIFYESPYRIVKTLKDIISHKELASLNVVVCRELTKIHETIYRGTANEVLKKVEKNVKGEFVIVINKL